MDVARQPYEPALEFAHLAPTGGVLGDAVDDFRVEEIPLYDFSGDGDHWYVHLEKRGITTPQLLRIVARASGAREADLGRAGLKDRHAVTTQWLSVPAQRVEDPETWELPDGVRLLGATRHRNKLRPGHLAGNRFTLRLHGVTDRDAVAALVAAIAADGVPNFYGTQRFGVGQGNLDQAWDWLGGKLRLSGPKARFLQNLLPSVVQSEFFNRYLVARRAEGTDRFLAHEWVRLDNSQRYITVDEPDAEQHRLASGDLILTGALPGGRTEPSNGRAGELEQGVCDELGLVGDRMRRLLDAAPGARRDLRLTVSALQADVDAQGTMTLSFTLPAGGYATQVAREFTRLPWHAPLRAEAT